MDINVFSGRAEDSELTADLVTLRAVEKFDEAIAAARELLEPSGRLALLIGAGQADTAKQLLAGFQVKSIPVPASRERILVIASRNQV